MRAWLTRFTAKRKATQSLPVTTVPAAQTSNTNLSLDQLLAQRFQSINETTSNQDSLGPWMGPFRSHRHGQGLDFDDLRPYVSGDDVRHIDWKVSARTDKLHTRLYREEKEHVVTCLVDFRSLMFTGSGPLRAVSAGLLGAKLLWQAVDAGHRVGLAILLPDNQIAAMPAANGESAALQACGLLADSFSQVQQFNHVLRPTSLDPLIDWCVGGGRALGSLLLVSGLDHLCDNATPLERLKLWRTARPVVFIQIRDPLECHGLPSGRYTFKRHSAALRRDQTKRPPVKNEYQAAAVTLGFTEQRVLKKRLANQQNSLKRQCQLSGIQLIDSTAHNVSIDTVLKRLDARYE